MMADVGSKEDNMDSANQHDNSNCNKENSSPANRRAFVAADARAAPQRTNLKENRPPPVRRPSSSSGVSILSGLAGQPQQQKQHKLKSRFTVIRKLGKGTYGKVQLAVNKETGQEVAIKTIKKTKIENDQDLQRVKREIQIMSSIEHPHIIHIYEVFENKDKIVLIMQYAPGGELYEYVSQSKVLDDSEARRLFRQIATAIYYCHQNKICHRDLKLENILLDEKNNAKLADFGLSNVFDKRRLLKTFCGSPLYASPEIVQGSPYEGPEVDCWSLGVLLYTLVYGAMPFDGSNFKRLVKQISEACYYEPPQKSLASPLIGRLLCADPLKRANILDICSDPWVNGSMIPRSPRHSPTSQNFTSSDTDGQIQQSHASLMKVAQDMANLTPVRLDILLALAPTQSEMPLPPPQATIPASHKADGVTEADKKGVSSAHPAIRVPSLDVALMEVDENRATSPVASYIVRNLDDTKPSDSSKVSLPETMAEDKKVEDPQTVVSQPTDGVNRIENQKQEDIVRHGPDQTAVASQREEQPQVSETKGDLISCENLDSDKPELDNVDQQETNLIGKEIIMDTSQVDDEFTANAPTMQTEELVHDDEVAMDIEKRNDSSELTRDAATAKSESPMQQDPQLNEKETEVSQDQQQPQAKADVDTEQDHDEEQAKSQEEKPKKVKKRIVVVKRKKKVSKRDADSTKEDAGENNNNRVEDKDRPSQDSETEHVTTRAKIETGKVRIPETFQSPPAQNPAQQPAKTPVMGRRQSALIADVSQKLLQHQQQSSGPSSSAIEEDQQQLAGVRVSDKLEEFERRTSLANEVPTPIDSSRPVSRSGDQAENVKLALSQESKPVDSRQESVSVIAAIEQTTVEPVATRQKPSLAVAPSVVARIEPNSESTTPTGSTHEPQSKVAGRLAECASLLSATCAGEPSPNLSPPVDIRDDRSDSVDTIKAELGDSPQIEQDQDSNSTRRNVRSSLQINLSPGNRGSSAVQPTSQPDTQRRISYREKSPSLNSANVGPAPIARSYKKVTFTKDGTCVTETGKIYSTQGDDGTVRRIERKSKVTHYPDDGLASSARQEIQEEVVYENRGQHLSDSSGKLWPRHGQSSFGKHHSSSSISATTATPSLRPFERLIMPANEIFTNSNLLGEQFETDSVSTSSQRGRQAAYQQSGRADSASSCSSGSTDVFDDTFDTWTGAISMFHQGHRLSDLHNTLMSRAFGAGSPMIQSIFSDPKQRRKKQSAGGSLAGTPLRCESVEPPYASGRQRSQANRSQQSQRQHDHSASEHGGYESDVPTHRPASATLGSARGRTFGSSNLFPRASQLREPHFEDPFGEVLAETGNSLFGRSIFEDIEIEHEKLRSKFAQQHKHFWKGSTPSLINFQEPITRQRDRSQDHISTTASVSSSKADQSQSRWLRQSVPLSSGPQRRNTASSDDCSQVPAQSTSSKTSVITSQMAQMNLAGNQSNSELHSARTHRVASFIELNRSPSGQTPCDNSTKQRQVYIETIEQQQRDKSAKLISQTSDLSSTFWDGRVTPNTTSSIGCARESQSNIQENPDSRVRNWLQQSSGNLSVSSGSRSSASETLASSSRSDPSSQMFTPISMHQGASSPRQQQFHHQLPPAPSRSPNRQKQSILHAPTGQQQQQVVYSRIIRSSSRQSIDHENSERNQVAVKDEMREQRTIIRMGDDVNRTQQVVSRTSSSELRVAGQQQSESVHRISPRALDENLDDNDVWTDVRPRHIATQQQTRRSLVQQPTSAPIKGFGHNLDWLQSTSDRDQSMFADEQYQRPTLIGDNDFDDSLSGSAADLESRSSSSLLDQLRSRGYRSMISQRMGSQQLQPATTIIHEGAQTSNHIVTAASSGTSLSTGAGGARVITSSHITLNTSAKSFAGGDGDGSARVVQRTISSQQKTRPGQGNLEEVEDKSAPEDRPHSSSLIPDSIRPTTDTNDLANPNDCTDNSQQIVFNNNPTQSNSESLETKNDDQLAPGIPSATNDEAGDDLDEDVRDAKASIKEYLDRMRETEKFLKSLHEEEESQEKQRQQLFIFNNLLLNTKLNGIRLSTQSNNYSDSSVSSSAPIWSEKNYGATSADGLAHLNPEASFNQPFETNSYLTQGQIGHRNLASTISADSRKLNRGLHEQSIQKSTSCFSSDLYEPVNSYFSSVQHRDPLEPVQPYHVNSMIGSNHVSAVPNHLGSWQRSKSQLGDQFYRHDALHSSSSYSRSRRPLSATIDANSLDSNPYFPKNRRSMSQIRAPMSSSLSSATSNFKSQSMVSEYQSSFGPNLSSAHVHSPIRRRATSPLTTTNVDSMSRISARDIESSDDSDAGLRDYRVSSYVPRLVPETSSLHNSRHSRDFRRRSLYKSTPTSANSSELASVEYGISMPQRRTSLQLSTSCARDKSTERSVSPAVRRRSLVSHGTSSAATKDAQVEPTSSRLSELEQRIQANKRRREELLMGNYDKCRSPSHQIETSDCSPNRDSNIRVKESRRASSSYRTRDANNSGGEGDEDLFERPPPRVRSTTRGSSPQKQPAEDSNDSGSFLSTLAQQAGGARLASRSRSSRLESMEARIKRRSYCVRTSSPERPKTKSRWSSIGESSGRVEVTEGVNNEAKQ